MALLKPLKKPDKRWRRPETRDQMLFQIDATYSLNDWGMRERAANARSVGLEPKPLQSYSDAELKAIHDDLDKFRMILFED